MGIRFGGSDGELHPRDILIAGVSALVGGALVLALRPCDTETRIVTREVPGEERVVAPEAIEDGRAVVVFKDTPLVIDGVTYTCDWGEGQEHDRPGREIVCDEKGEG